MKTKFWTDLWFLMLFEAIGIVLLLVIMACAGMNVGQIWLMHVVQWSQNLLMLAAAVAWVRYYKKERVRNVMYAHWPGWKVMAIVALLMVVSLPAMNCMNTMCEQLPLPESVSNWAKDMLQAQEAALDGLLNYPGGIWSWVECIALMCVATALAEEATFRGALLRCLIDPAKPATTRRWLLSAVCVGFIFSLIHMEVFGFVPRMLLGALFTVMVWRTRSIWPGVLAHAMNNLFAVIEMKAAPQWLSELCEAGWAIGVSAVLSAAVLWWLLRARR